MSMKMLLFLSAFLLAGSPAGATEKLFLDFTSPGAADARATKVEVWRVDPSGERKLAHKGDADKASREGVELPDGSYEIYLEDQGTGLIFRVDGGGKGLKLGKRQSARVDTGQFVRRIREIKEKDKEEQAAKSDLLSHQGKKSVFAVAEPAAAASGPAQQGEFHAPGELLVKFQPDTTLADRYTVMQELEAESRSKLQALDVYRVKVSDTADLQGLIRQFADDPRLKYLEMNMVVSVPEPVVEEDTRR